jgi:Na+/melibiose symporter-like transporter
MSTIPAGIGVLSVILAFFYKLDENTMEKISGELERSRKKEPVDE